MAPGSLPESGAFFIRLFFVGLFEGILANLDTFLMGGVNLVQQRDVVVKN